MAIQIQNYQAIGKGCLTGRFDAKLTNGITLVGCAHFTQNGASWVKPPQGPTFAGRDGVTRSADTVKFDTQVKARFDEACLAAIKELAAQPRPSESFDAMPF